MVEKEGCHLGTNDAKVPLKVSGLKSILEKYCACILGRILGQVRKKKPGNWPKISKDSAYK